MALPTTIVSTVGVSGHAPPFKSSAGNFYAVLFVDGATEDIEVFKATDPTDSWTAQDSANGPSESSGQKYHNIAAVQDGDLIHIASFTIAIDTYKYHSFNMATDTWSVVGELIETPTNFPTRSWISIGVRSWVT